MPKSPEKLINERLADKSSQFLQLLKNYPLRNGESLGLNDNLLTRIDKMDTTIRLESQYKIKAANGRKSNIDLYFNSPDLKIIIELKVGKGAKGNVGFRGIAQAA
jgi:hypothetical protein